MTDPNPSIAQARVMVDELRRHGVDHAFISPGSRSAALAIALEESPSVTTTVVLDERSAGFRALGRARATGRASICLSTSGTAVANYLPAVVEADMARVPIVFLTADRPPELRGVSANQTIDQVGIFGSRTRWFCDVGMADTGFDGNAYWRSVVSQAAARANGHGGEPGPVHLNVSFREPTVPVGDDGRNHAAPYDFPTSGRPHDAPWQESQVAPVGAADLPGLSKSRGVIVAGEGSPSGILEQADRLGWPVLATALSGLRSGAVVSSYHHILADGIPDDLKPEVVVTVGHIGPSDRLGSLTGGEGVVHVQMDSLGKWIDPRRDAAVMVHADPVATLAGVAPAADDALRSRWLSTDAAVRSALDSRLDDSALTGPAIARSLSTVSPDALVVASSMPIRDVDAQVVSRVRVVSNRGSSGIDGFLSTAIGVAGAVGGTLALSGDLSFLHDVSALGDFAGHDLVLVVIDNAGGGLFDLLPQAIHAPSFEKLFVAPHGLDLVSVARGFGLDGALVPERIGLSAEIERRLGSGGGHVLVAPVDREDDLKMRRQLDESALGALRSRG